MVLNRNAYNRLLSPYILHTDLPPAPNRPTDHIVVVVVVVVAVVATAHSHQFICVWMSDSHQFFVDHLAISVIIQKPTSLNKLNTPHIFSNTEMSNQLTKRPCLEEPEQPARQLPAHIRSLIISYACHPLGRRTHQRVWCGFKVARAFTADFPLNDWAVFYLGAHLPTGNALHRNSDVVFKEFLGPAIEVDPYDSDATVDFAMCVAASAIRREEYTKLIFSIRRL